MNKVNYKTIGKDSRGVFGLTSVQTFFAVILAVAILAYVIVIVMGVLTETTIIPSGSASVSNESAFINSTGYTISSTATSRPGFRGLSLTSVVNSTSGATIPASNYTLTGNVLTNSSAQSYNWVNISYTYVYDLTATAQAKNITSLTGSGVSGFFSNISPVYAILAVLVIILVLVVLVRVVSGGYGRESSSVTPL